MVLLFVLAVACLLGSALGCFLGTMWWLLAVYPERVRELPPARPMLIAMGQPSIPGRRVSLLHRARRRSPSPGPARAAPSATPPPRGEGGRTPGAGRPLRPPTTRARDEAPRHAYRGPSVRTPNAPERPSDAAAAVPVRRARDEAWGNEDEPATVLGCYGSGTWDTQWPHVS